MLFFFEELNDDDGFIKVQYILIRASINQVFYTTHKIFEPQRRINICVSKLVILVSSGDSPFELNKGRGEPFENAHQLWPGF